MNNRDHFLGLCTHSFSESEIDLLKSALEQKWNLKCRKEKVKGKFYVLIIVKSSMDNVRSLIREHLHSSMLYKVGL